MKKLILVLISLQLASASFAKEGMWIPLLLEKYNIEEMQEKGFKLTAEDIYSINQASMKDAVMIFGGGCTAELISDEGLVITNHHCGYSAIQSHSTIENDYLTNGFWAMSEAEELPNPDLTVTFLKYMKDVTDSVLMGVEETMTMKKREEIIEKNIKEIKEKATKDTHYTAGLYSPQIVLDIFFRYDDRWLADIHCQLLLHRGGEYLQLFHGQRVGGSL